MKKRYLRAGLTLILSSTVLMSSFSAAAQAGTGQSDNITIPDRDVRDGIVYSSAYLDYLSAAERGDTEKYGDVIPDSTPPLDSAAVTSSQYLSGTSQETFEAVYDPRTLGLVTPVKDQGMGSEQVNSACRAWRKVITSSSYFPLIRENRIL